MKKKFTKTKLVKETIRLMAQRNLRVVAGGSEVTDVCVHPEWVTSPFTDSSPA